MSEQHRQALDLSSQAALLHAAGKCRDASGLYARAAWLERSALLATPAHDAAARGALSVNLASMLVKAEEYEAAEREVEVMLGDASLPEPARRELRDLLADLSVSRVA